MRRSAATVRRASAPPGYIGGGAVTTVPSSTPTSVPRPTVSAGDMMLAWATSSGSPFSTPSGWTLLTSVGQLFTFWKLAGGSEPSTYTFGGQFGGGSAQIIAYSNLAASPVRASATLQQTSINMRFPSVTATAGDLLIGFGRANGAPTITPPASYTERTEAAITGGGRGYVAELVPAVGGATGIQDAAMSGSQSTDGIHVALIPA